MYFNSDKNIYIYYGMILHIKIVAKPVDMVAWFDKEGIESYFLGR